MAWTCSWLPVFAMVMLLRFSAFAHAGDRQRHVAAERIMCPRPDHVEYAKMARYVVHLNSWGSVATSSIHLGGIPYAAIESYSDGPMGESTGRLMFFLTALDATGADVMVNSNVSLGLAEAQIPGSCQGTDPEDPTCAKVSISGQMMTVPQDELKEAEHILFSRHPIMKSWPAGHRFILYELQIATIRLLDFYGGAADLTPQEFFAADVSCKINIGTDLES